MISRDISGIPADPEFLSGHGRHCFVCGDAVSNPAVMWQGCDGQGTADGHGQRIFFHGPCVYKLLPGLMRDASELRYPPEHFERRSHRAGGNGGQNGGDPTEPLEIL
jgi:hypothetical protein